MKETQLGMVWISRAKVGKIYSLLIFEMSRSIKNCSVWSNMEQEDGIEENVEGHPVVTSFMSSQNVLKLWAENYTSVDLKYKLNHRRHIRGYPNINLKLIL